MYSAIKVNGQKLYDLARQGREVARKPRKITIFDLALIQNLGNGQYALRIVCSKGTYIRVLAEDIGRTLGTGAHLTALRRTRVGHLTLDKAVTVETLEALGTPEAVRVKLTPSDALLSTLEPVRLEAEAAKRFLFGQRLPLGLALRGRVRVYDNVGMLLGTALVDERGVLAPERLIAH